MGYEPRNYRQTHQLFGHVAYQVVVEETDLWISSQKKYSEEIQSFVMTLRSRIREADQNHPGFIKSLMPIEGQDVGMIEAMLQASRAADVGPMAAVAGVFSQEVATFIQNLQGERTVCVENGGDIFLDGHEDRIVAIYAGASALSNQLGIRIGADQLPLAVCTSAGTVGHSLSFGKADAVVILSKDGALADAVATATGNHLKTAADIDRGLNFAKSIPGVIGVVLIIENQLGIWGEVELVHLAKNGV